MIIISSHVVLMLVKSANLLPLIVFVVIGGLIMSAGISDEFDTRQKNKISEAVKLHMKDKHHIDINDPEYAELRKIINERYKEEDIFAKL